MKNPMAAVRDYIHAFNRGDREGLAAAFADNFTGDSAYVVVPGTMTFKVRGQQLTHTGAVVTVALCKLADGWRIAARAWAKGRQ